MDALLKDLGSAFGGFLDSGPVQVAMRFVIVYVILLWLVAAFWAYRDLRSRTDNQYLPFVAAGFILVFTPVLFPFAAALYRVGRPPERLGEAHERMLAEEALLAEVETVPHCPGCGRRAHDEWIICPTCRTRLSRVCPSCSRHVGLDWSICAWCGKDFEHYDGAVRTALPVAAPVGPKVRKRLDPGRLAGAEPAGEGSTGAAWISSEGVAARTDSLVKAAGSSFRALRTSVRSPKPDAASGSTSQAAPIVPDPSPKDRSPRG